MGFKMGDLLGKLNEKELAKAIIKKEPTQTYLLELEYEKDRTGKPIYSRICKVIIQGLSTSFFY